MLDNTNLFPNVDFGGFEAVDPAQGGMSRGTQSISSISINSYQFYLSKQLSSELKIREKGLLSAEIYINKDAAQVMIVMTKQSFSDKSLAINSIRTKDGITISSKGVMRQINQIKFMDLDHFSYVYRPTHVDVERGQVIIDLSNPIRKRAPRKHNKKSGVIYGN